MNHLFIVAHPDDEILASYGTIKKLIKDGETVSIQVFSTQSKTREDNLKELVENIHRKIGIKKTYCEPFETMRFAEYDRFTMTKAVEKAIIAEKPDVIYTHDSNDIHKDHRTLSEIVLEASKLPLRGTGYNHIIKGIYFIETPSSTDWGFGFVPNAYFEIDEEALAEKEEHLAIYNKVIREVPHPRNYFSFKSLARYRGGQCGAEYAEAYKKVYEVNL